MTRQLLPPVGPLIQKYKSAYYIYRKLSYSQGCHGFMFEGIASWYDNEEDALRLCEIANHRAGLPHINVRKSSHFHLLA